MTKEYPIVHAGSPLKTNACVNRECAEKAFKAGVTVEQIAEFWPEVWQLTTERGRTVIGQKYDYMLGDGSERLETKRMITRDSLRECIRKYTGK